MADRPRDFGEALAAAGLHCSDAIIADDCLHRYHIEGDRTGSRNGWYVLHLDGVPAGAFGTWKGDVRQSWCAKEKDRLTREERQAYLAHIGDIKTAREAERLRLRRQAAERACIIWADSNPIQVHPYLARKGVKAYGVRQHKDSLVVPVRDGIGGLRSLQFISPGGEKRFLKDGATRGHYHAFGAYQGTLCIAEGYATAAVLHQKFGYDAVAVAFFAGNLKSVAVALRAKLPEAELILAADNDRFTPGNPGVTLAYQAALVVGGKLTVPRFPDLGPYDYYLPRDNPGHPLHQGGRGHG